MKALFAITILITSVAITSVTSVTAGVEAGDAWYNAAGKVVKVTPVQKEKERFVPAWEKREAIRISGLEARRDQVVRPMTTRYYEGYSYGRHHNRYGWSHYSGYSGCYGYSGRYHTGYHHGAHSSYRPYRPYRFGGTYRKSGWSLRVKF